MKVEQINPETFKPVTLTLESQDEVDIMRALTGRVVGHGIDDEFTYKLYNKLVQYASLESQYSAQGTVHLRKEEV